MRSSLVVLALSMGVWGCGFQSSAAPGGDDGDPPGGNPPPGDNPPPCTASIAKLYDTCQLTFTGDLELPSGTYTYDTDQEKLTDADGAEVAVGHVHFDTPAAPVSAIYAENVHLASGAHLRATGARGFAIIAAVALTLDDGASVDVSAGGAGARTTCDASGAGTGTNNSGGAGGGGGGGFGAAGGDGGRGNSDFGGTQAPGGKAGAATAAMPSGVIGGCPGGAGGRGDDNGGAGGL
ncbi:MAG TPA: hypothetical protein VFP84_37575, partial [Kofleriaceae bacterium]|nr:hypothetical protein [Kofleriaceae bacterium]